MQNPFLIDMEAEDSRMKAMSGPLSKEDFLI